MNHRIRGAALIISENKILMVKHSISGNSWWIPPGGGVEESDSSIMECITREVMEETGYKIKLDETPKFIREFFHEKSNTLNLEIFFYGQILDNVFKEPKVLIKSKYIEDVKWLSLEEIQELEIYPVELKKNFGLDYNKQYLGRVNWKKT